jgi:DNA-binding response OmpR family regulator
MNPEALARGDRVLLVSADSCDEVKTSLLATGYKIVNASDGEHAISQTQHATFGMAVLVSTGKTMDMAETVFNLRDTRPAMPIVIITAAADREEAETLARACPNVRSLPLDELALYFRANASAKRPARRRKRT